MFVASVFDVFSFMGLAHSSVAISCFLGILCVCDSWSGEKQPTQGNRKYFMHLNGEAKKTLLLSFVFASTLHRRRRRQFVFQPQSVVLQKAKECSNVLYRFQCVPGWTGPSFAPLHFVWFSFAIQGRRTWECRKFIFGKSWCVNWKQTKNCYDISRETGFFSRSLVRQTFFTNVPIRSLPAKKCVKKEKVLSKMLLPFVSQP